MHDKNGAVRVLIVDDSAFMRVAMQKMLETDSEIKVVDVARNGEEALEKIRTTRPDLVTLDIEMPVMDGLQALQKIMKEMPLPVIMVSALTEEGADATFQALELGAVDFIPKGGKSYVNLDIVKVAEQLRQKVKTVVRESRRNPMMRNFALKGNGRISRKELKTVQKEDIPRLKRCGMVTIGVSTGGPMALNKLIPKIPKGFSSSIFIVQHMPPMFTGPFANKLNRLSQIAVKEAVHGETVEPGCAYVAPGGIHLKSEMNSKGKMHIALSPEPADHLFVPSVDVMMTSVAETFRGAVLGVIMTGMGNDGLKGMTLIKNRGGTTIAQDEASCVVYGMPKACVERGIVDRVLPLEALADEMVRFAG